ncbi:hypothetical protein JVU11DRAFT_11003 [Chiua virens]|nr:hypothetical protein JVU11DRAFT_11003 [Chiua virens]
MPFTGDPLGFYGKRIIEEHHASLLQQLPPFQPNTSDSTPDTFDISSEQLRFLPQLKVGILGAGVGGLYTALMLDSIGVKYEILESSNRTGGRLSTYKFPQGEKYDYYEKGAMRFPLPKKDDSGQYKDGTMKRLAELTEYPPLNKGQDRLKDKLIPYYYRARDASKPGFYYFNGSYQPVTDAPKDPFNAESMNVDAEYVRAGADAINDDVTNPFVRMVIKDIQTDQTKGWEILTANDLYSVRAYMSSKYMPSDSLQLPPQHLSTDVVNWCELLGESTSAYDRGLTEAVFELLAFAQVGDSNYGDVDWKCFEGGTETLSKKLEEYIRKKGGSIRFQNRVTSISKGFMIVFVPSSYLNDRLPSGVKEAPESSSADEVIDEDQTTPNVTPRRGKFIFTPCVRVQVNGNETKRYSHVISTLPLPVLRTVDMNDAGLTVMQRNSLRGLDYGPSVKIAVLFKTNWWTTKLGIIGGQSFTDLPIRTIVYPSYGVDSDTPPKVLIASYSWTADAERLGALAVLEEQEVLKELVLRNLAEAHQHLSSEITYDYLKDQFVDMDTKDWGRDAHTMGAFADFGPGDFEDLYAALNTPAAGNRLHFAGEAISTRHAWVVGALDSAWKAVYQYLKVTGQNGKIDTFKKIWGENVEWTSESTLVDGADLLDQHLGLVNKAILGGVIAQSV